MNLVKISEEVIIDKDKVQALVNERHNVKYYTHVYLMGNGEFLVEGHIKDIEGLINESEGK